jgi:hypothetical protein
MQGCRHSVLDGSFYRMSREARTYPFPESSRTAANLTRTVTKLFIARSSHYPRNGSLAEHAVFPVLPIGMLLL